jgi:hypothetical protein
MIDIKELELKYFGNTFNLYYCYKNNKYYKESKKVEGLYLEWDYKTATDFLTLQGKIEMKKLLRTNFIT